MAKKSKNTNTQYVRKETMWLVTLLALAVGFFGGVMFAVFKTDTVDTSARPPAWPPKTAESGPANMIAELEKQMENVKPPVVTVIGAN